MLQDNVLPELGPFKSITQFSFMVSMHDSSPDVILGNDFLNAIGLMPDHKMVSPYNTLEAIC